MKKVLIIYCIGFLAIPIMFIRTVPDYSMEKGYAFVSIFDKYRYNQGYCLKQNKILTINEIKKAATTDFLKKSLLIDYIYNKRFCKITRCTDLDERISQEYSYVLPVST